MNHFISLSEGEEMTARYRSNLETVLDPAYQGQAVLPFCETFDKAAFETLLAKNGCAELRIYYGMDEQLKIHAIIVAVDAEGRDMLPASNATVTEDEDLVERGIRCPELCPPSSPLNS